MLPQWRAKPWMRTANFVSSRGGCELKESASLAKKGERELARLTLMLERANFIGHVHQMQDMALFAHWNLSERNQSVTSCWPGWQ